MQRHPLFCDRETVEKAIKGKHVCLIGSGPGLLMNVPGFVDSHEVVIRVNNYAITGHRTGKRTDIHYSFYGSSIRKKAAELQRDGVTLCMCKCPDAQFIESEWHEKNNKMRGVDFRYIYEQRKDFWFTETYVPTKEQFLENFNLLGGHVPTTGFAAILDVLTYKPVQVFCTGFDFFQTRIHNLHEQWSPANPDDPIGHLPDAERAWLQEHLADLPIQMDQTMRAALNKELRPARDKLRRSKVFRRPTIPA